MDTLLELLVTVMFVMLAVVEFEQFWKWEQLRDTGGIGGGSLVSRRVQFAKLYLSVTLQADGIFSSNISSRGVLIPSATCNGNTQWLYCPEFVLRV